MLLNFFFAGFLLIPAAVSTSEDLYTISNDGRCLNNTIQPLTTVGLLNNRQCAIMCSKTTSCGLFMAVQSNKTCALYAPIKSSQYLALTFNFFNNVQNRLRTYYVVITSSTTWTVPIGTTAITGTCIGGGGGGGGSSGNGGGGSGNLAYGGIAATAGTVLTVTIGQGGAGGYPAGSAGGNSSIGSYVNALGGSGAPNTKYGGAGGSGGGAAPCCWSSPGGAGGKGGNSGGNTTGGTPYPGGTGQGTSVWTNILAIFNNCTSPLNITAGSGGVSPTSFNSTYNYGGGGGGGGLVINGVSIQAGTGTAPVYGATGGVGYGAGGGGSGCFNQISSYAGGNGTAGACVIIWSQ